ncbi:hypothetical protein PR202_gb00463 [Eleusine coracana subsp. coracana]|uniref:U-box domain-containing protein n=1 Tax=Eleusine coracana subsp. coracana TaxID=191504 RepID=A0AAV5DU52_ELECO|nr:hypothetical protein QOZ80_5BG0429300 [Eleusine coracana subsp. coracana]GJN13725.1 hypothetical protein PR202_gb00463 [Eleusine coracana subsp. coracana]
MVEEEALLLGSSGMRHHLTCPISLQPMQDPVTSPAGISYDRRAIERWLGSGHATCPVTGHPLSLADLTPNHTLRRLIQSHYYHHHLSASSSTTPPADREPQPPDAAADVVKKLLSVSPSSSGAVVDVLRAAAEVASRSHVARRHILCDAAGVVVPHVLRVLVSSAEKKDVAAVDACLAFLRALLISGGGADDELPPSPLAAADTAARHLLDLVNALTDALVALLAPGGGAGGPTPTTAADAVRLLDSALESADAAVLSRLRPELFHALTAAARARAAPRAALRALLRACHVSRNRLLAVDAGAAHEAVELELDSSPRRTTTTEVALALLAELCLCAEGRAAVTAHPAGIAVVARRLLRVSSAAADASAVQVLASVAGRAAAPETLREMARVGAVGKLCCVLQADCDAGVKDVARQVLRMHSGVWSGSPCVSAYLLSRYL